MARRYLIDSCIWIDALEDRKGYLDEELGLYAIRLLLIIMKEKNRIVISDFLLFELEKKFDAEKLKSIMMPYENILDKVMITQEQLLAAHKISSDRQVPFGDALHAIVARDLELTLVTRDRHFNLLKDIAIAHKPENLI